MSQINKYQELKELIIKWGEEKGLSDQNPEVQVKKMVEEFGELTDGEIKDNEDKILDSLGDMGVVGIIMSSQAGIEVKFDKDGFPENNWGKLLGHIHHMNVTLNEKWDDEKKEFQTGWDKDFELLMNEFMVDLQNHSMYLGTTLEECLELVYDEIKGRTGKIINGTLVKSEDLKD